MGLFSIAATTMVLFFVWLTVALPTQKAAQLAPSSLAAGVRNSTSCESLKAVCASLAAIHDDQTNYLTARDKLIDRMVNGIVFFVIAWGVISAAGYLYIFKVTRATKEPNVAV